MAYRWTITRIFASLAAVVVFAATSFVETLQVFAQDWQYTPPDAATSLALDRIARVYAPAPTGPLSRFKAFIERALSHPSYIAGGFDPGRMPA